MGGSPLAFFFKEMKRGSRKHPCAHLSRCSAGMTTRSAGDDTAVACLVCLDDCPVQQQKVMLVDKMVSRGPPLVCRARHIHGIVCGM